MERNQVHSGSANSLVFLSVLSLMLPLRVNLPSAIQLSICAFSLFMIFAWLYGLQRMGTEWHQELIPPCYLVFIFAGIITFRSIHETYTQSHFFQNLCNDIFQLVFGSVNIATIEKLPLLEAAITMFLGCTLLLQSSKSHLFKEWNPYSWSELDLATGGFLFPLLLMTGVLYGMIYGLHRLTFVLVIFLFVFQVMFLVYMHAISEEQMRHLVIRRMIENKNTYHYLIQNKPQAEDKKAKALVNAYNSHRMLLQQIYWHSDKQDAAYYGENYMRLLSVLYERFSRTSSNVDLYAFCVGLASMPARPAEVRERVFQQSYFQNLITMLAEKCRTITIFPKLTFVEPYKIKNNELRFYIVVMIAMTLRYNYEHAESPKQATGLLLPNNLEQLHPIIHRAVMKIIYSTVGKDTEECDVKNIWQIIRGINKVMNHYIYKDFAERSSKDSYKYIPSDSSPDRELLKSFVNQYNALSQVFFNIGLSQSNYIGSTQH